MDDSSNKPNGDHPSPRMPRAVEPAPMMSESAEERAEKIAAADDGRNPVFDILVRDEGDLEGLVAYALYKQNKRDWLVAFSRSNGRSPDDKELASYILGERTPRRIETYRRLAADALSARVAAARPAPAPATTRAGDPPATRPANSAPPPASSPALPIRPAQNHAPAERSNSLVTIASMVVVALVLAYLVYRFGGLVLAR